MSVRLADRSFQYAVGIAKNMLVKVGKFTFPADFVILEMKEDSKVPLILGRPFLHTADVVIRVKHKQLNLGLGIERMIFNIDSVMKHSYSNNDTCFSIDVIDEILEEDFDALLDEGRKILHSIKGPLLEEDIFSEFDEFMAMTADENSESKSDTEEPPFEKIINIDYKIKTSLEEPPTDLELKPLPDNLEYVFLEEPSFLPVIISSQLSTQNKSKLVSVLKNIKKPFLGKRLTFLVSAHHSANTRYNFWMTRNQLSKNKEVVINKNDELVPTRTVTGWRYFQIPIDPMDQEKTTFTCPFGTYAYRRMPFGLCNAPATFQRCMLAIFHDMIKESVKRCKDAHLVLNWETCHFMVKEGIVLGHKVSSAGLEVYKAKIDVISKLPPPTNIKGVRSFLGHAGFYRRFIKDFLKIARPLTKLLEKDTPFEFNDECQKAFEILKKKLMCALVIVSPNWNLPFELMCDASDFAVGVVLGQKVGKNFYPIYFASKTLNPAQQKYTVAEKELMAAVFAFDKFRSDLILSKTIVHTDHSASKHLFKKQDAKPCLIQWILLLQEFDIEIKDGKGTKNVAADHLSPIKNEKSSNDSDDDENFLGETLMEINTRNKPWFVDFANYLVADIIPKGMTYQQKNKFFSNLKHYFWEEPYLFKVCFDGMIRRCVSGPETRTILDQCHYGPTKGHYGPNITAKKVLDSGFYWPTIIKEAHTLVQLCEACQKTGNISKHDEMPLKKHSTQALPTNDARVVITFLKKLFCHFRMPKDLISDQDLIDAGEKRMFQLHELDELRHQAYENSRLYKARTKVWHDRKLRIRKEFKHGNKVLLFHSKYKFKQPKLRSRWLGPYVVKHQYPPGYVELYGKDGKTFIINGHRLKLYHEEEDYNDPREVVTPFFPKE
ncbi:reverse transcriptase domain-containing protein [Tanacetum coccineum]